MANITNKSIVGRWNSVITSIGCEHLTIDTKFSELEYRKGYYDCMDGIDVYWMLEEATYWLSCYYECGNVRCEDRFNSDEDYKIWVSETGKLKRLISRLKKLDLSDMIVVW